MTDANEVTRKHTARVNELLIMASNILRDRGFVHDASKFDPIEAGPLQEMQDLIDREGQVPFGTPAYEARKALLGPMLKHHYENNSHHPEHYPVGGVSGMDLFDLVEMFFDWKAASERGEESSLNLTALANKYKIDQMLCDILVNTSLKLGYKIS